jgi:cytochrome c-type biogenesis protein CcsB
MATLESVLFHLAFAGYAATFGLYLIYALTRRETFSRSGHGLLIGVVAIHAASLAARWAVARVIPGHAWYVPWSNWFESFSLFALAIGAVFLLVQAKSRLPILGVFVLPWSVVALVLGYSFPLFSNPDGQVTGPGDFFRLIATARDIPRLMPALQSVWMAIHVPVMFAAYAAFANAFGLGLAYLVQGRQLKSRHPGALMYRLPPIEDLERLIYRIIMAAFPVLTLGIILGARWAYDAWGRYWGWDPKETWAFITWLVYLVYLHLRLVAGWRGRRTVYFSLAGFAVVMFTYIGVNYLSNLHGFLSGGGR